MHGSFAFFGSINLSINFNQTFNNNRSPYYEKKSMGLSSFFSFFRPLDGLLSSARDGLLLEITFTNSRDGLLFKMNAANNEIDDYIKDKHNSEKHRYKNLKFKLETTEREDVLSIFRLYSKIIIRTEYKVSSMWKVSRQNF